MFPDEARELLVKILFGVFAILMLCASGGRQEHQKFFFKEQIDWEP